MPLQGGMCEDIRIVPILWDMPTLRRDECRDPRIMGTARAISRKGADIGFLLIPQCSLFFVTLGSVTGSRWVYQMKPATRVSSLAKLLPS